MMNLTLCSPQSSGLMLNSCKSHTRQSWSIRVALFHLSPATATAATRRRLGSGYDHYVQSLIPPRFKSLKTPTMP